MPRKARGEILDPLEVQTCHTVQRCVRRAFLCGEDPLTGQSFEHRRGWIRIRPEFLASAFGVDWLTFSVMSNHLHNAEDKTTGHFWEGRYKLQNLLDEASLLARAACVGLNPIRADLQACRRDTGKLGGRGNSSRPRLAVCPRESVGLELPLRVRRQAAGYEERLGWPLRRFNVFA